MRTPVIAREDQGLTASYTQMTVQEKKKVSQRVVSLEIRRGQTQKLRQMKEFKRLSII